MKKSRFFEPEEWFEHLGLVSYPRSGNSMLRKLIEELTGIYSGSDTSPGRVLSMALKDYGLTGESLLSRDVWLIKSHWPERMGHSKVRIERAVLLWRQPLPTFLSFWHMTLTGTHSLTASDYDFERFGKRWRDFVREELGIWVQFYSWWLNQQAQGSVDLLVVSYERLLANKEDELNRLVDFMYTPTDSPCISAQTRCRFDAAWQPRRDEMLQQVRERVAKAVGEVYKPRSRGVRRPASFYFDDELRTLVEQGTAAIIAELTAASQLQRQTRHVVDDCEGGMIVQDVTDCGVFLNDKNTPATVLRARTKKDPYGRGQPWKWRLRKICHLQQDWDSGLATLYTPHLHRGIVLDVQATADELLQHSVASIEHDGFVCLPDLLTADYRQYLAERIDAVFLHLSPDCSPCWVMNVHQQLPATANWLWRLATDPSLLGFVQRALGTDDLVLSTSQLLLRHPDNPYSSLQWQCERGDVCTVWLFIDDFTSNDDQSPAFRFCRGWHQNRSLPKRAMESAASLATLVHPCKPYLTASNKTQAPEDTLVVAVRWPEGGVECPATISESIGRNKFVTESPLRPAIPEIDFANVGEEPTIVDVATPAGSVLVHSGFTPMELRPSGSAVQRAISLRYVRRTARICQQTCNIFFRHCFSNSVFRRALYVVHGNNDVSPYLFSGPPLDNQLELGDLSFAS